ncbi:MAG: hypothetical protein ACREQW_20560 [Candidatus Binatia bacterium]
MMKIDIEKLSDEELIDLNNRVIERLRFLNQMRRHSHMPKFQIGERVTFKPEGHPPLSGMVTRYNKKTVTVITDNGQHWNVSPGLLRRAEAPDITNTPNTKVVPLRKE